MIDYNKILKENSYGILATLDDSKPKTRILQYLFSEKNKVYLALRAREILLNAVVCNE